MPNQPETFIPSLKVESGASSSTWSADRGLSALIVIARPDATNATSRKFEVEVEM
jgi:hypothetical protein